MKNLLNAFGDQSKVDGRRRKPVSAAEEIRSELRSSKKRDMGSTGEEPIHKTSLV